MDTQHLEERLQAARAAAVQGAAARRVRTTQEAETAWLPKEELQRSARESEARVRAAAAEIDCMVQAGRLRIRSALENARGEIEAMAAEAAQHVVRHLTGISVDNDDARKAIKLDLNC